MYYHTSNKANNAATGACLLWVCLDIQHTAGKNVLQRKGRLCYSNIYKQLLCSWSSTISQEDHSNVSVGLKLNLKDQEVQDQTRRHHM